MASEDVNMDYQLSHGALKLLLMNVEADQELWDAGYTFQILSLKKVPNARDAPGGLDRYRIIISDGEHYAQSMLATQLSYMVDEKKLAKNTIIRVDKLTCNIVQGRRLLIMLSVTPIAHSDEKIGDPENLDSVPSAVGAGAGASAASPAASGAATPTTVTNTPAAPQKAPAPQAKAAQASKTHDGLAIFPIEGLSPYQNKWAIKARVAQKSEIRTWSNQRGDGKLFNVSFVDESGEIRATGFNSEVDSLYDRLEEGKVYIVAKGRVSVAKKKFSNTANDFEITFSRDTEIKECTDQADAPQIQYNFVQISDLNDVVKDATCDVIGIVKDVSNAEDFTSQKFNRVSKKRELTLVDRSEYAVRLTLWGKQAESYNAEENAVIAFKGVRVGDFQGRSLSMVSSTIMTVNPDMTEAHVLRGWYDSAGKNLTFKSQAGGAASMGNNSGPLKRDEFRTLLDVKESELGTQDRVDYFQCRATIVHIRTEGTLFYPACKNTGCSKKVVPGNEGWLCEKCQMSFSEPEYRYIFSMSVADYSGQAWLSGFNDIGAPIFGMSASDMVRLKERDENAFNAAVKRATCKTYNFSCRAKTEFFNDSARVRYGVQRITAMNYKEEAAQLSKLLKSSWAK